jgi:hypothetical protein
MGGLLVQFLGLGALLGLAGWGYRHWISPRQQVGIQGNGMLLLCVVTLVGGLLGSTGWWIDDPRSFAWDLPPRQPDAGFRRLGFRRCHACGLASARSPPYAASDAHAGGVPGAATRCRSLVSPRPLRPCCAHHVRILRASSYNDRCRALVSVQAVPNGPADSLAPTALVGRWLGLVAAVCASWGLALFVTDNGPSGLIWVWPGDLLTGRLIAVMLLTIAVGAVYALRYADVSRVMLGVIAVYSFGVMLANLWNILASKPVNTSYVVTFGIMFLVSAILLIAER